MKMVANVFVEIGSNENILFVSIKIIILEVKLIEILFPN
jgi:hypothetical protein